MKTKLIIFDLDETIIELFKFHNKATNITLKKVFGIDAWLNEIDFVGNTIKKNLTTLAKLKKINKNKIKTKIPKAIKLYDRIFISIAPKNSKKFLLPGAYKLIKELSKNKNNFLIVLTGDSERIAQNILKKIGLLKNFHFLITGEHKTNRIKLMKKAVNKARKETKQKRFKKIIVIGDSIHDIGAGKAVGALTIAVLTGYHSKKQLKKEKANYIFKNLKNNKLKNVLQI